MPHPRKSAKAKKNPKYHGDDLKKRGADRRRKNKGEKWERKKRRA